MRQAIFITVLFSTFFIEATQSFSQTTFACGTEVSSAYLESQIRSMPGYFGCEQINKVNRKLSILFQVIRDSLGGTGISDSNLQGAVDRLNEVWAPTGISFEFCERRNLDNHQFNNFVEIQDAADMRAMYYEPNIINVFISNTIIKTGFGPVNGYAVLPGGPDIIHVTKGSMGGEYTTLVHEMGHFLGLLHTFETETGLELVDGSNCATTGDLICDTEANPTDNGADFTGSNCNYTGNPATDSMGNFYVPPSKNFMTYSNCRCQFTKQQYNRMVEQYLLLRNYLW